MTLISLARAKAATLLLSTQNGSKKWQILREKKVEGADGLGLEAKRTIRANGSGQTTQHGLSPTG